MRPTNDGRQSKYHNKGGCLPREANFVSESESPSFEGGETAWKAGTLPTELLPLHIMSTIPSSSLNWSG